MGKTSHENSVKKPVCRTSQKRMLLLRRRLSALMEEKESLEAKNQDLINSLNEEKKKSSELQQQVFTWQRLYHEALISLNTYKVKNAELIQNLSLCLKDMNLVLPHLVGLTTVMCQNKTNLTTQLNYLHSSETEHHSPRAFGDWKVNDMSREKEKVTKRHKVGPMVMGFPIQKPTVRLNRFILSPPPNEEASPSGADLSTITEENEQEVTVQLGQISMRRPRKRGLGSGERWRKRKQQQSYRHTERDQEKENRSIPVADESSDSDSPLTPVLQLQRVSGLLLSPNLMVERGRASEGKASTGKPSASKSDSRRRSNDNPLEGCSWMNVNLLHTNKKDPQKATRPSLITTDSSDEEDVVVQKNVSNNSSDSLYDRQSVTVSRKNMSCSLTAKTSEDVLELPEPDSTSNVLTLAYSSVRDSLGALGCNTSAVSPNHVKEISQVRTSLGNENQKRCSNSSFCRTTPDMASSALEETARHSISRKRSRSFYNSTPISSPGVQGKRVRKPKSHCYPGEESDAETKASKSKKTKPVKKINKKSQATRPSVGRKSLGKSSLKRSLEGSRGSSITPSAKVDVRPSQGRPGKKVKSSNKSSIKKSLETPRNSAISVDLSSTQEENGRRGSRRAKGPVSYKESPLNVKMRRPK